MNETELKNVVGGASWGIWAAVTSVISFALGFIEGLTNPVKCGK